ncbi:MAG: phosphoribosyltransferase-like protein [Burkholderiales bacterium]
MNEHLALKTISELLMWDIEARNEFAWLKLLSTYKYDAYEGYEPGMRFYASLIGWLKQFPDMKDRKTAYAFLKQHLVFFSRQEITHLVHRYWPLVQRTIVKSVADDMGIPTWQVMAKPASKLEFNIQLRQSLFVGLSDGAKMDVFRRDNEGRISNEQTVVGHEIYEEKWSGMLEKLSEDILKAGWTASPIFKHIFLIDDFTASGTSLIRKETNGKWGGKISKFIDQANKHLNKLNNPCKVHVHHYIGTKFSKGVVVPLAAEFQGEFPKFKLNLTFGIIIDEKFNVSSATCKEFYELVGKHYDPSVETDISKCVRYGYKQGHLAVVLEHNTPNNTVGLIWAETSDSIEPKPATPMTPLFRRRARHT